MIEAVWERLAEFVRRLESPDLSKTDEAIRVYIEKCLYANRDGVTYSLTDVKLDGSAPVPEHDKGWSREIALELYGMDEEDERDEEDGENGGDEEDEEDGENGEDIVDGK